MLGEAGATVYCTGRSVRGNPSPIKRPETIEETAEMVTAYGGVGLWAQVDHSQPTQVQALIERVAQEQNGQLDLLVNDMTGDAYLEWTQAFWQHSLERGLLGVENGVLAHLITSYYAAPLLVARRQGLIVEINDGNSLQYNDVGLFYSFIKSSAVLLAYYMAEELRPHNVAAVSLTPGYLRSEALLEEKFGVTEATWRDAIQQDPGFAHSETPFYVGRAVVALAADPTIMARTGRALSSGWLAREYGFTDVDGTQPPGYHPEGLFREGYFMRVESSATDSPTAPKPDVDPGG
jgi:NAD(P)-dependent dehydrogenase (short-subunit alcohol dehydrogenase family)